MTWRTSLIQTNLLCNAPGLVGDKSIWLQCATKYYLQSTLNKRVIRSYWAWIPDVILFESKTISLSFELWVSLGILRPAPSMLTFFALGAGLGIPSEPRSSKVRLIVLLSNRITSGIHALNFDKNWLSSDNIVWIYHWSHLEFFCTNRNRSSYLTRYLKLMFNRDWLSHIQGRRNRIISGEAAKKLLDE